MFALDVARLADVRDAMVSAVLQAIMTGYFEVISCSDTLFYFHPRSDHEDK